MSEEPSYGNLPEEFHSAIKLDRFHRFSIGTVGQEVRAYFGLLGEDGSHSYYSASLGGIKSLAMNFNGLATHSEQIAAGTNAASDPIPFETRFAIVALGSGENSANLLLFYFTTLTGDTLVTAIKPEIALIFASSLNESLASLPTPITAPKHPMAGADVPGQEHQGQTVEYFGQQYDPKILQAFGVLMVRANLLDRSLIRLLSTVSRMSAEASEAAYYSTLNFKARTDTIRAIAPTSNLPDGIKEKIGEALEKANAVAARRNDLVHSVWKFEKEPFFPRKLSAKRQELSNHNCGFREKHFRHRCYLSISRAANRRAFARDSRGQLAPLPGTRPIPPRAGRHQAEIPLPAIRLTLRRQSSPE